MTPKPQNDDTTRERVALADMTNQQAWDWILAQREFELPPEEYDRLPEHYTVNRLAALRDADRKATALKIADEVDYWANIRSDHKGIGALRVAAHEIRTRNWEADE
jgi:hypothetical protein